MTDSNSIILENVQTPDFVEKLNHDIDNKKRNYKNTMENLRSQRKFMKKVTAFFSDPSIHSEVIVESVMNGRTSEEILNLYPTNQMNYHISDYSRQITLSMPYHRVTQYMMHKLLTKFGAKQNRKPWRNKQWGEFRQYYAITFDEKEYEFQVCYSTSAACKRVQVGVKEEPIYEYVCADEDTQIPDGE